MKCIKCGQAIASIINPNAISIHDAISGYQCVNSECSEFEQPWSLDAHKDNAEWNVRHTRTLEQRVQTLESQLKEQKEALTQLLKRLGV